MDANTEDHVSITQGADGQLQTEQRPQRGQPFRHLDAKLPASKLNREASKRAAL